MKLEIGELDNFVKVMGVINTLQPTLEFKINEQGFFLRVLDASHAAMIDLKIQKEYFTVFEPDKEETIIKINGDYWIKILDRYHKSDKTTFTLKKDCNKFVTTYQGKRKREFIVPLLVIPDSPLPEPKTFPGVTLILPKKVLSETINDIGIFSESIMFQSIKKKKKNQLLFIGENVAENQHAETTLEEGMEDLIALTIDEEFQVSYGLEYLRHIKSIDSIAERVELTFDNAKPVLLVFQIGNYITFKYMLAPYENPEPGETTEEKEEEEKEEEEKEEEDE